ncbi:MAG: hypothetical protein JWP29_3543 [Rhodoferax sp.]|nr:hypothetical protein [Rhodoferax sp.]
MPEVRTYDASKVLISVGGFPISGFADGTFVTVTEMTEGVASQAGADGEVARSMSNDPRVTVVITLQQTSLSNQVLSTLYRVDKLSGSGVVPLAIEDLLGGMLFFAGQAWITKAAEAGFGKEVGTRAWTITAVQQTLASLVFGEVS